MVRTVGSARRLTRRATRYRHTLQTAWTSPGGLTRVVPSPVFVLSPVRSGSTLLRVILNSHSQICAPHEMHLRHIRVRVDDKNYARNAVRRLGLDEEELENLLWDRLMLRELSRSGKRIFVDKTPGNVDQWRRLAKAWPAARFIFLIRHPGASAASLMRARPNEPAEQHDKVILRFAERVEQARRSLGGLVVRYEDLTTEPEQVTRTICRFLGTRWEPAMLDYGARSHGAFQYGLGDWTDKIKSGRIHPARPNPPPESIAESLRSISAAWGYL